MASGRYPYSLTINGGHLAAPVTMTGALNVVNDSASLFGKGWDMPGLLRIFSNSVSGVPAGVLLSTGDGGAWYFTRGAGNSYSSPAGPHAFDTLTSITGGGWKLVEPSGAGGEGERRGDLATEQRPFVALLLVALGDKRPGVGVDDVVRPTAYELGAF